MHRANDLLKFNCYLKHNLSSVKLNRTKIARRISDRNRIVDVESATGDLCVNIIRSSLTLLLTLWWPLSVFMEGGQTVKQASITKLNYPYKISL